MDIKLIQSLQKSPAQRTDQDLYYLESFISSYISDGLTLYEEALQAGGEGIHYESHPGNKLLYRRGDVIDCWYAVLSGTVFIDNLMYPAGDCFGIRERGESRRTHDCLILEPSEFMVIEYPAMNMMRRNLLTPDGVLNHHRRQNSAGVQGEFKARQEFERRLSEQYPDELSINPYSIRDRGMFGSLSIASDTSSLYSGSDLMASSTDDQGIDLTGLIESAVDSDDEDVDDDMYSESGILIRDAVMESLQKDPEDRTDEDIEILLEEIQHLPAFSNMTLATRRALCAVMNYVLIEKAGTPVMVDGEELDSWAVILNGQVQITKPDASIEYLQMGDSFGITPTMEKLYHQGIMHTRVDNCQFVCIPQDEYYKILHKGEENTQRIFDQGGVVLVTEERILDGKSRKGNVIIRGSPDKLLHQLVEDESYADATYVEDFLLTYRTFIKSPLDISRKLLAWFNHPPYREKVISIVLQWVTDHYSDFEAEPSLTQFLDELESLLQEKGMKQHIHWLSKACAEKTRPRVIVISRASRDEVLPFSLLGGSERGLALYISKVEPKSKAEEAGLKRGDQILEVNGTSFDRMPHGRALEVLRKATHLSITVRSNMLGFKDMLQSPAPAARRSGKRLSSKKPQVSRIQSDTRLAQDSHARPVISGGTERKKIQSGGNNSLLSVGHGLKIRRALMRFNILPKSNTSDTGWNAGNVHWNQKGSASGSSSPVLKTRFSSSHPDLSSLKLYAGDEMGFDNQPEHVLKVFRVDQAFKYLLVYKETTAHEVVMLSLKEFGMTHPSSDYCLCEVTVQPEGFIKQRCLPETLNDLADRCSYNSRYYIRDKKCSDPLISDEAKDEVLRECQISFLMLNCAEVAAQLSLRDFQLFHDIKPVEYINDLFELESKFGSPNLKKFAELSNVEMFWVVSEVCSELNVTRRVKIIKHFIIVAKHCLECKNYNSLFAIISGLGHGSVSRLKQTWDKLPAKYMKLFEELQKYMDPSRNMSKYRNLIASERPPLIPFYPLVKKDLTFIHLGNDSMVDNLVNYEKLRMVAKEVRHVIGMAPAYCHLNAGKRFTSISTSAVAMLRQKQRGSTVAIPKKMFEEAQMARKVRAYLAGYLPVEDEVKLCELSNQCEPSASGHSGSKKQQDNNSPGLLLRQAANLVPKFGTDSPDAVHKLMSLSDRVRPHDPHRTKMSGPVCGVQTSHSFKQTSSTLVAPYLTADSSSVNNPQQSRPNSGSTSYSPSGPRGSRVHRQVTETDSGHHSIASNCDSNSTSSVGSTGSPSNLHPGPELARLSDRSINKNRLKSESSSHSNTLKSQQSRSNSSSKAQAIPVSCPVVPGSNEIDDLDQPSTFIRKQHSIHRRGNTSRVTEASAAESR